MNWRRVRPGEWLGSCTLPGPAASGDAAEHAGGGTQPVLQCSNSTAIQRLAIAPSPSHNHPCPLDQPQLFATFKSQVVKTESLLPVLTPAAMHAAATTAPMSTAHCLRASGRRAALPSAARRAAVVRATAQRSDSIAVSFTLNHKVRRAWRADGCWRSRRAGLLPVWACLAPAARAGDDSCPRPLAPAHPLPLLAAPARRRSTSASRCCWWARTSAWARGRWTAPCPRRGLRATPGPRRCSCPWPPRWSTSLW